VWNYIISKPNSPSQLLQLFSPNYLDTTDL
jgi:hypothetical protein